MEVNRTSLRVWGWGDPAARPVVLVHGAYDHGRMFDELAPRIADLGYHVVAPDLRGHGDSGRLDTGMAWTLIHLDLGLLIRHLGAGPAGLVGHSFGAGQALGVGAAFPELVRWVISLDGLGPPTAGLRMPEDVGGAIRTSFVRTDRMLLGAEREQDSQEAMVARRSQMNPRMPASWVSHLVEHGTRRGEGGGWVWKADAMFGQGVPSEFNPAMLEAEQRACTRPVLAITGTEPDTWRDLSPEEEATRISWMGARHVAVPGTGHYVHLEAPDAVMSAIADFVREQDR